MPLPEAWSAFDLAEAFHLASAIHVLHEEGILRALARPRTAEGLARKLALDPVLLRGVLEYVSGRSEVVRRAGRRFSAGAYDTESKFILDQYIGAYGPNVANLGSILRNPSRGRKFVDREKHARAFIELGRPGVRILPELVARLGWNHLLDLGCGPGSLLIEIAQRSPTFVGWGLDSNPNMCAAASRRARQAGFGQRLRFFEGECTNVAGGIPRAVRNDVETIIAASVFNEFFADGPARMTQVLQMLKKRFPGRGLMVSDYYGRLGKQPAPWPRRTALHDFVQLISSQGVPPRDLKEWRRIYRNARCSLVHVIEDPEGTAFIHILKL